MENDNFNLGEWLSNKIVTLTVQVANHQNIEFDKKLAVEYLTQTSKTRFKEIVKTVKEEQEESKGSFLFNSPAWQSKIFETNLTHALLLYAKDILNYAKIDKTAKVI